MDYLTTMNLSQCFRVLNVSPSDPWEFVRKTYYRLAKKYHPDLHPGNLAHENKLKEITCAFETLETHYKIQVKHRNEPSRKFFTIHPRQSRNIGNPSRLGDEPLEDSKIDPRAGSINPVEKMNRKNHWLQRLRVKLTRLERTIFLLDIRKNIRVHPQTAIYGGLVRMRQGKKTFQVKIPPGSWNSMSLRIPERGEHSLFGKKRGDLLLNIQVIHSEQVGTSDKKFYYEIPVPREKIKSSRVLTLDSVFGPIKFVLPRKTKDGQNFVLKTLPNGKSSSFSNHVVTVHLV